MINHLFFVVSVNPVTGKIGEVLLPFCQIYIRVEGKNLHLVLRNGLAYGRALLQGFNRFIAGMAAGIIDEEQCVGRF